MSSIPPPATTQIDLEAQQPQEQNVFQLSAHPSALFFHFLFRILAIAVYILGSLFSLTFTLSFVLIILLLAFDFWTVKNVSGRLLVGLRWWSQMKEDGTEEWVFESRQNGRKPNASDSRCFWWSLYLTPIVWAFLALICILKLNLAYLVVVITAVALSGANLLAYRRCDKDQAKKLSGFVQSGIVNGMMGRMFGS